MLGTINRKPPALRRLYAAAVVLCLLSAPPFAAHADVPVRTGVHAGYTRLVFDFGALTAYNARIAGNTMTLSFDTREKVSLPGGMPRFVESIRAAPGANGVDIVITAADGATFRHFRLIRKVVVDVEAPAAKPKAATPAPVAAASTPVTAAPETTPPKESEAPSPPVTAEQAPAETIPPAVAALAEGSDVVKVDLPPPPPEPAPIPDPTVITLSTVGPTRLAAFRRHDHLWVVIDSSAAGVMSPDASGPQAGLLGRPRVVSFPGGTAYLYRLPGRPFIDVRKKNMAWEISLNAVPLQATSPNMVNVEFDQSSQKAKLIAPLRGGGSVLEIQDPDTGDMLFIVPVGQPGDRVDQGRHFTDVEVMPAAAGMVVRPLRENVRVTRIEGFVLISASDGIIATPASLAGPVLIVDPAAVRKEESRLFDFPSWRQGGIERLNENRRILEQQIAAAPDENVRHELLMKLALLYFANNFGQEALAVLRLVSQENPDMAQNPNFIALRGAAAAMASHYREALQDLSHPAIQQHPEVNLWIGFAAAATEQWQKANRSFPTSNSLLIEYPDNISIPFTIYMAESALRLGRADTANTLLGSLDLISKGHADPHYMAAISYLRGEAARQEGKAERAIRIWRPIADGLDRLYHTKASLALTNLEMQQKLISPQEAVDRLESLRFAWRGDGLEVQILHNLGLLKTQNRQFLSGLEDMRRAAELADRLLADADPIRADMRRIFAEIFVGGQADTISPLEAVSLYNQFNTLMPDGAEGSVATLNFADFLIRMDLLEKAEGLMEEQLQSGFVPPEKIPSIGTRLAAVYLLDGRPTQALQALQKTIRGELTPAQAAERGLLRARAQSQLNMTDAAIATLSTLDSTDATRLKADVLWRARRWDAAATALEKLLPAPEDELTPQATEIILNTAVAHKLAGNTAALQQMRERYNAGMQQTPMASTFSIVTRPGGRASLADRETLMRIAGEVDLFKGFLENYKSSSGGS